MDLEKEKMGGGPEEEEDEKNKEEEEDQEEGEEDQKEALAKHIQLIYLDIFGCSDFGPPG